MNDLQVYQESLIDKKFVGQWNAARYFRTLKFAVERRYVEQILAKPGSGGRASALLDCTPESLQVAMLDAAAAGLSFSPTLGHAYLIPYKNTATFSPGYRGIIHLAVKGGTVLAVQANRVHASDPTFKVWTDEKGTHLEHEETRDPQREKSPVTHAYALARFANGGHHIEVMNAQQLAAVETAAESRPGGGMVWNSVWKSEMEKKAPIRRGAKFWPLDPDGHLAHALATIDKADPIDFDRAETPAGGEVVISQEQALALHAAITDRELPDKLASDWLLKTAQARGYAQIEQLPASMFDTVLGSLTERAKAYVARSQSTT